MKSNIITKVSFLVCLFCVVNALSAQMFVCYMENTTASSPSPSYTATSYDQNWAHYIDYDYHNTSIKTVRITFHIMQNSSGGNNFPENSSTNEFLTNDVMNHINYSFSHNQVMNIAPELAPFHEDTRIRFELANVYYWQNDNDNIFKNLYNNLDFGDYLKNKYVTSQPGVGYKENSIHLFFCASDNGGGGRASAIGGGNKWVLLDNMHRFSYNDAWVSSIIRHEVGHSMGLMHTFYGDDCDDTQIHTDCWDEEHCPDGIVPNNVMSTNYLKNALTQCQINRMHYYLLGYYTVSSCLVGSIVLDALVLTQSSSVVCNIPNNVIVEKLPFGVQVDWNTTSTSNNLFLQASGNTATVIANNVIKGIGTVSGSLKYGNSNSIINVLQKPIWINGYPNNNVTLCGNLTQNVGGKIITTCNTAIVPSSNNITIVFDESVTLNAGFEVKTGASLSIENANNNCP